jgi:hypothetical protein
MYDPPDNGPPDEDPPDNDPNPLDDNPDPLGNGPPDHNPDGDDPGLPNDGDDDPDNDPDPDHLGHHFTPSPPPNPVADAMRLLAQTITASREPSKTKVREPDVFDGTNPKKLRTFLVQCQLNFEDRPTAFTSGKSKVTFSLSYLTGTALAWFEPTLLGKVFPPPPWLNNYTLFTQQLERNFGPYDAEGEAENAIDNLVMKDSQRIAKYVVEFYRLAAEISWDDASLRRRFYKNLPARIKNEISRVGKPRTLNDMRDLAQAIDQRYWEREDEIKQETNQKKSSPNNSANNSNTSGNHSSNSGRSSDKKKPSNKSGNSNNHSSQSNSASSSNNRSGSSGNNNNNASKTPEFVNKLGKDGKLTSEERQRRMDNKLCLFCGQPGHNAANCPKSSSNASKAKARSSNLVPSSETSDSKK